ncbi:hypothetical protein [Nocardia pseudovaccinii]|uniref:hypothetical protein n=1 Tax=Nocardia pseudovaccinii TaxID=189540 RepID=UPI0007A4C0EF|nr:hypothetical protein [Nocardia pseudovaccinii]
MIADRATEFLEFQQVPDIRRSREMDETDRWLRADARSVIDNIDWVADIDSWTIVRPGDTIAIGDSR